MPVMVVFHADACAAAGIPAVLDPARRALLARREHELGIQLPAAVAEWYSIAGAVEHPADQSRCGADYPLPLPRGGDPLTMGEHSMTIGGSLIGACGEP